MTIDEAISKYRKLAKLARSEYESDCDCYGKEVVDGNKKLDCLKSAEECEQTVEWLEEMKELRKEKDKFDRNTKFFNEINVKSYEEGYNKAIDDFAISIKEYLNKFEVKNLDTCVLLDLMNRKAEKLKAGNRNES